MPLNLSMPMQDDLKPRITVFGVGGAGGNAVNNMIEKQLDGVEFVVANTDAQALQQSTAQNRIQMGVKVTEGLGAGARPAVGAAAAEETIEEIVDHLAGAHMCFITAGMGGGTGTGAAPIIAQAARELGVLTVGVVTKPFQFEGAKRMRQAEDGVDALQKMVDTLIIIPNQNLFRLANEQTTFTEAFSLADDVLYQGVKGVTDLMVRPGLINLDFADVRAVMDEMGKAMMGTGEAEGEARAVQAAEKAIANPLLDEISLKGAKGVLINITGGHDLTLFELDEAANRIREEVDAEANIIVGSTMDGGMEGKMRVSVVATGIDAARVEVDEPVKRRSLAEPLRPTADAEAQPAPTAAADIAASETAPAARADAPAAFPEVDPATAHEQAEDIFSTPAMKDDGLPGPAYQPEQTAQVVADAVEPEAEADLVDIVPPRRKSQVGRATSAELDRLEAIIGRNRKPADADAGEPGHGKGRMTGINSLITRMTGSEQRPAPVAPVAAPAAAPAAEPRMTRQQPPLKARADTAAEEEHPAEDPRVEIPAFLRRQAN